MYPSRQYALMIVSLLSLFIALKKARQTITSSRPFRAPPAVMKSPTRFPRGRARKSLPNPICSPISSFTQACTIW